MPIRLLASGLIIVLSGPPPLRLPDLNVAVGGCAQKDERGSPVHQHKAECRVEPGEGHGQSMVVRVRPDGCRQQRNVFAVGIAVQVDIPADA